MIKANLYSHQKDACKFVVANNGVGALFFDVGCGKTLTTLAIFNALNAKRMLVICPLSILENAWGGDINKFTTFSYCNLREKYKDAEIYLINYEGCLGSKFPAILDKIRPDMLVLDESVRIKNNAAITTKTILKYSKYCRYRMILTGCPAPNNMMEYWSQMTFLKEGIFDRSFYAFRNRYFHLQRGSQIIPPGMFMTRDKYKEIFGKGFEYQITDKNRENLTLRMRPYAIWVKKEDCLDLPEQIDVIRSVTLNNEEKKHYKQLKDHLVTVINQEMIAATTALTKIIKLREVTSGFLMDETAKVSEFGKSKLNELENLLETMGDKQAIIWINFKYEAKIIVDRLGIDKCAQVHGDIKDKNTEISDFTSGKKQYLIANPASASSGLNLQNADTQIFFSLSYSYDDYYQCRGRTHRSGQKNKCTYIHLIAKDSIDEDIYEILQKKENAVNLVYRIISKKRKSPSNAINQTSA